MPDINNTINTLAFTESLLLLDFGACVGTAIVDAAAVVVGVVVLLVDKLGDELGEIPDGKSGQTPTDTRFGGFCPVGVIRVVVLMAMLVARPVLIAATPISPPEARAYVCT